MIGLGLRLTVAGGREAVTRIVIIAAAVALGVGLLLATLAGLNAANTQNGRYAWLGTSATTAPGRSAIAGAATPDPLWWLQREDYFGGEPIARIDVAATGPHSPVPPGIARLPGPGQFYASPALDTLLHSTPAGQLADRFPGHEIGTIGPAALPAPNSLIIFVGRTPEELSPVDGAEQVTAIATQVAGVRSAVLDLILSVVAAGLLFPVLIFIGTATRLAATRREQRFAAMRLVGATPRQVSAISAVESTAAALAGTAVGFALFFLFRHPLAAIPFTATPFFDSDMSLNLIDVLLVVLGVPVGAAVAARVALRRVRISPLGVTRRVTPRAPRVYRLIPLLAGIGELAYFVGRRPETSNGQTAAYLPGFLLIMTGLIVAGPWLTMVGARLLARRSGRPATLIAARRLADNPQAAFRAVSGLVLGLFVTSAAVGIITTIVDIRGDHRGDAVTRTTLSATFWPSKRDPASATAVPDTVLADLRATPGVRSVTVLRRNPVDGSHASPQLPGLVSCADLARAQSYGRCPPGATVATVWMDLVGPDTAHGGTWRGSGTVWQAVPMSVDELDRVPVGSIAVDTDGSAATVERARTILETAYPAGRNPPATNDDSASDFTHSLVAWQQLANVVIIASLPIAGCGLAVSIAGGLSERKRPFSLLRLSGVSLRVLRRVVALESAVPLLVVAAVAIGTGLLAAQLFLKAQLQYSLHAPGPEYYLIVLIGLAASLGIIASTLPLLRRITGPETARNE
jgi:hypothetical protein